MDTITAVRFRHATEQERRMGRSMIPRLIRYDLSKAEMLAAIREALAVDPQDEGFVPGVTPDHLIVAEAGRPLPEPILKALFDEDTLQKSLLEAEPDAVGDAEDLRKSEASDPDSTVYERITVVRERIAPREERPLSYGIMAKSQHETFLPSVADLRDRLMTALRAGDPVVKAEDVPMLDGGRVRENVLRHLYPGAVLEEHQSTESLLKSIRGDSAGSEMLRAADELVEATDRLNKSLDRERP